MRKSHTQNLLAYNPIAKIGKVKIATQRVPKKINFFKRNKVKKNIFILQKMDIYCKNGKKHTECTHPKKLVLISDRKVKAKSEYAKCLTIERFLIK